MISLHTIPRWGAVICLLLAVSLLFGAVQSVAAEPLLNNIQLSGANPVTASPRFQLTPDGSRVVYLGSIGAPDQLFSAPVDGSAPPITLGDIVNFGSTVHDFVISPDGSRVVYRYGSIAPGQRNLFSVPITGGDPVQLNPDLPDAAASVEEYLISPDGTRVVYRADAIINERFELFSVPIAGGAATRLNRTPVAGGSVTVDFAISPNSLWVVYRADLDVANTDELYRSRITATGSTRLSPDMPVGGDVTEFAISPNNLHVVYRADQDSFNSQELYRVPLYSGPGVITILAEPAIKLNGPLVFSGNVLDFQISPDSAYVVFRANGVNVGRSELYSTALSGGAPITLTGALVDGGTVQHSYAISPDGDWVVYRADQEVNDVIELFATPIFGGGSIKLNEPPVVGGSVERFAISPNSDWVVYRAEQELVDTPELYSVRLPANPGAVPAEGGINNAPRKLNRSLIDNGEVREFLISADGTRVIYRAEQETINVFELYNVPITDGDVTKVNGALVAGGGVESQFALTPNGAHVVYRADQVTDNVQALFATSEGLPTATITGPAEPLPVGDDTLYVLLSPARVFTTALIRLEQTGGDAVEGVDYTISTGLTPVAVSTAPASGTYMLPFQPGLQARGITLEVLNNLARTAPRTLELTLTDAQGAIIGAPNSLTLTLAPADPTQPGEPGEPAEPGEPGEPGELGSYRVYLPLLRGN